MGKTIDKQYFMRLLRDATWVPACAGKATEGAGKAVERAGEGSVYGFIDCKVSITNLSARMTACGLFKIDGTALQFFFEKFFDAFGLVKRFV
jgi:hypothetical protein